MTKVNSSENINFKLPEMSDGQFQLFSELIYSLCGINLLPKKKMMLVSRLYRRLRALNIIDFNDYYNFLLTSDGRRDEIINMIDAVSTNKTQFFREPEHFAYLTAKVLPEFIERGYANKNKTLNVWSAGCSTGEEPYSIAISLSEFCQKNKLECGFKITGTDISTRVLETASRAVYREDVLTPVPKELLKKYFHKSDGMDKDEYTIVPELKKHVSIRRVNLMDSDFKLGALMDIIFCRNVIIYFDKQTQINLFHKFYSTLNRAGFLFIGNSESLHNISNEFTFLAPTVYKKEE
ncbi:MAG: protein-glutamate O-methyltransferase [Spirochaetes bacterium]|nr:protein-glutamate O-methyltransferase [Spirochaetota bacterium]